MDQLNVIPLKYKSPEKASLNCDTIKTLWGSSKGKSQPLSVNSSIKANLNSTFHTDLQQPQTLTELKASEDAIIQKSSSVINFSSQAYTQEASEGKVIFYVCICNREFQKTSAFSRHLKQRHNYYYLSQLFTQIRDNLAKHNRSFTNFNSEQTTAIQQIQSAGVFDFPMPEELKNRINENFIHKAMEKYFSLNIDLNKISFELFTSKRIASQQAQGCLLSQPFMSAFKKLTLKYILQFQRHFNIFIKNITISELMLLFLFNFAFNLPKYSKQRLTVEKMQMFEKFLGNLEAWIDKNYKNVFKLHSIFYYHIQIDEGRKYCQTQRAWNMTLLIRSYLEDIMKRTTSESIFKFNNFILICFEEYIIMEGLVD